MISEIYIPDTRPIMASVRPGILETCELPEKTAEIIEADASFLDDYVAKKSWFLLSQEYQAVNVWKKQIL